MTSWWWESINGIAVDVAIASTESDYGSHTPFWTNTHDVGPVTGLVTPGPTLITPNTRLATAVRTPSNNNPILVRIVVSDQPTTPPPTNPP
jgi:hypothetical protein